MAIDLEELRQKKAFEELAAERGNDQDEVTTAFLIVQNANGQWVAYSDFADKDLSMERTATLDDIVGGCSNVLMGCQIQQTGLATVLLMEQRAAMMQQHLMQQQEANRVASLIDPNKLRTN